MVKALLSGTIRSVLKATAGVRLALGKLYAHARLSSQLKTHLPGSVVVLGRNEVHGTGAIAFGERCYLFPELYLETQGAATIAVGEGVVMSRGVHVVAMAGIVIGRGTMIGEYSSLRDANHLRSADKPMRESGFSAKPIVLGDEVWIGRGVTVLGGVTIGHGATVGANAVVTKDVPAGAVVAGVPAKAIQGR
ncbi:acyltransferase [Granulicella pectinivorans]|jgi:acetyltransferase-like isoleucine patch superfamily enzyme|nr:acyltransferase [Granulicella pectinivorans]